MLMQKFSLAIHGGAGTILPEETTPEKEAAYNFALKESLKAGYDLLSIGATALDAVEEAVRYLEDCPLFNAGRGSVFTANEKNEMDASIMWGKDLSAGAVAGITNIQNPISLARKVFEQTPHVFLGSEGAMQFAKSLGIELKPASYFFSQERFDQLQNLIGTDEVSLDHGSSKPIGTVGAVARDNEGNVAAATSTGGMTNKKFGRIGDTPMIGAGVYANNNTCAVSSTGHGEYFIRAVVAYDISCLMEYGGMNLEEACRKVVNDKLVKFGGEGGVIAVDSGGTLCLPFNSVGMYRGWVTEASDFQTRIFK